MRAGTRVAFVRGMGKLTALVFLLSVGCVSGELDDAAREDRVEPAPCAPAPDAAPPPAIVDSGAVDSGVSEPADTALADTEPVDTAPPPPTKLPLPDMSSVVESVGKAHPELVARSCQNEGGTWELMDAIVDELRKTDKRWGYNWKRGVIGDPSHDAIDYHWGSGPSEGSKDVYIIDVVVGHCGPSPQVGWIDVTEATAKGGTIGIWTGRGRF